MKSNIFKYLFIIFVIVILIVSFFVIKTNENKKITKNNEKI